MLPTQEACAKDAVKEDCTARACAHCDTIQAIVPRPIVSGPTVCVLSGGNITGDLLRSV